MTHRTAITKLAKKKKKKKKDWQIGKDQPLRQSDRFAILLVEKYPLQNLNFTAGGEHISKYNAEHKLLVVTINNHVQPKHTM